VICGLVYNFLPFMVLPIYVALERIDPRLVEAARDLYANPATAFRKVVFPLALPGVFAGVLMTFVPASSDYVDSAVLGSSSTTMIGQVIYFRIGREAVLRRMGWRDPRDGVTLWWKLAARNKRCVALDLKDSGDVDVFLVRLLERAVRVEVIPGRWAGH